VERTDWDAVHNSLSNNVESLVIPTKSVARAIDMDIEHLHSALSCVNLSRRFWQAYTKTRLDFLTAGYVFYKSGQALPWDNIAQCSQYTKE
jgi:hypothetical protein